MLQRGRQVSPQPLARRLVTSRQRRPNLLVWNNQQLQQQSRLASTSSEPPPFDAVLIANRGEIACRVIRTCRRLGVRTVAIYSSADGPDSLHASMADESHLVGTGPSAAESYLLQQEILDIAKSTQAQAIHPGYGFLSENAGFCQRVQDASLQFVGPPPSAIRAMGSKSESKAIMEAAGVPTTPGYHGANQDPEYLLHQAVTNVGFPLLIKAVMGGGGKGMRVVFGEKEFLAALESCRRESLSAFGDASVLLEKYLVHPRHVEVQVVADTHGNTLHLYERDCSLQRRHQKIIEEAPASDLSWALRNELGETGKRAAEAVGYVNAGTVEFLLDTREDGKFYFCEMNTRLQVEHPITELITGVDLVEWQLRIAAGGQLPIQDQTDVPCMGHALEARIYAENPARDFLPATGNVWHHRPPALGNTGVSANGVRVDTAIQTGHDIGVYYDPMISKLIVHGGNRQAALNKLIGALKEYQIAGVPTNIEFLVKCAEHPTFQKAGAVNTGFLEDHFEEVHISEDEARPTAVQRAVGAFSALLYLENRVGVSDLARRKRSMSPWSSFGGSWRVGGSSGRLRRTLTFPADKLKVECWSNSEGSFDIEMPTSDGQSEWFHIDGTITADCVLKAVINGRKRVMFDVAMKNDHDKGSIAVHMWSPRTNRDHSTAITMTIQKPLVVPRQTGTEDSAELRSVVTAPMPGKLIRINAHVGDKVKEGEVIMVMEAMKMEHSIRAPRSGPLVSINYKVGDVIEDGASLATVDAISIEAA